jgi:hypothetical protein
MDARDRYEELATEFLGHPGVSMGRALSNEVLKVNNKIFAFRKGEDLVLKLPASRVGELLAAGSKPFQSGGRTMKEWVAVPAQAGSWRELMTESKVFVERG